MCVQFSPYTVLYTDNVKLKCVDSFDLKMFQEDIADMYLRLKISGQGISFNGGGLICMHQLTSILVCR